MELVHGFGMYPATILETKSKDIVSCIVHEHPIISETSKMCNTLQEVADYHTDCFIQLEMKIDYELNKLENQTYEG